jgi:hypothetical protein
MIEDEDMVKDGRNLNGIYVRRREKIGGANYHTFEISEAGLRAISKHPIETDLKKGRKDWKVIIGDEKYGK